MPGRPVRQPAPPGVVPGGPVGRPVTPGQQENMFYQNRDNFCVRTSISMILGLLESEQQALQLYA